jgi:hypothetical protein
VRRVAAWLLWFVALFAMWLLFVGAIQGVELIAGICAAVVGTVAVAVVRSQGLLGVRVEWRLLRRVWRPVLQVVPDFGLVMTALVRRRRGSFRTLDFPVGGERAVDAGRRALAVVAPSLAPNRLVVDVDAETGEAIVHDLVPQAAPSELL